MSPDMQALVDQVNSLPDVRQSIEAAFTGLEQRVALANEDASQLPTLVQDMAEFKTAIANAIMNVPTSGPANPGNTGDGTPTPPDTTGGGTTTPPDTTQPPAPDQPQPVPEPAPADSNNPQPQPTNPQPGA